MPAIPDKVAGDVESSFRDGLLDADIVRDPKKTVLSEKKTFNGVIQDQLSSLMVSVLKSLPRDPGSPKHPAICKLLCGKDVELHKNCRNPSFAGSQKLAALKEKVQDSLQKVLQAKNKKIFFLRILVRVLAVLGNKKEVCPSWRMHLKQSLLICLVWMWKCWLQILGSVQMSMSLRMVMKPKYFAFRR